MLIDLVWGKKGTQGGVERKLKLSRHDANASRLTRRFILQKLREKLNHLDAQENSGLLLGQRHISIRPYGRSCVDVHPRISPSRTHWQHRSVPKPVVEPPRKRSLGSGGSSNCSAMVSV